MNWKSEQRFAFDNCFAHSKEKKRKKQKNSMRQRQRRRHWMFCCALNVISNTNKSHRKLSKCQVREYFYNCGSITMHKALHHISQSTIFDTILFCRAPITFIVAFVAYSSKLFELFEYQYIFYSICSCTQIDSFWFFLLS